MASRKRNLQAVPAEGSTGREPSRGKTLTVPIPESETKLWLKLYGLCQIEMIKRAGGEATDLTASQVVRAAIKNFGDLPHDQILKAVIEIYERKGEVELSGK